MNMYGHQAGAGYPAGGGTFVPRRHHTTATVALALGVLSWFGLGLVCAIPAWILGARALREIGARPDVYSGEGAATAGMWLGIVHTLFMAFAAIVVVGTLAFGGAITGLVLWLGH